MFGVHPEVCSTIWNMLMPSLPKHASSVHLLWSLMFLKVYASEHINSMIAEADEKKFRKWTWKFIILLADIGKESYIASVLPFSNSKMQP